MDANGNIQLFVNQIVDGGCPPITATATETNASCTDNDGAVTITAAGGTAPYQYSIDGINWQAANSYTVAPGSYTFTVEDATRSSTTVAATISLANTLSISPSTTPTICQGNTVTLATQSNGQQFSWTLKRRVLITQAVLQPHAGSLIRRRPIH